MLELLTAFILEKGGIFGILLAFSLGWIFYREKVYWNKDELIEKEKKEIFEKIDVIKTSIDSFIDKDIKTLSAEISESKKSIEALKKDIESASKDITSIKTTTSNIKSSSTDILKNSERINAHEKLDEEQYQKIQKDFESIKYSLKELSNLKPTVNDISKKANDLWDWHSVKDSDGLPIWYMKKSIENDLIKIQDSILLLNKIVEQNSQKILTEIDNRDAIGEKLQELNEERIDDLKSLLDNYTQTMKDLSVALDKIKFLLKTNLSED